MKKYSMYIVSLSMFLFMTHPSIVYSLERDYIYSGNYVEGSESEGEDENGESIFHYMSDALCYDCFDEVCFYAFPSIHKKELDISIIPASNNKYYGRDCSACFYNKEYCYDKTLYAGYLHFRYKGDYPFLKRQIEYSKKYPQIEAYWPETSQRAEKISDIATLLFEHLVDSTALKKVKKQSDLSRSFLTDSWYFNRINYCFSRSLSASCFRFSDFYRLCTDLEQFSNQYFTNDECVLIAEKTGDILDKLCGMFLELYRESLSLHPTEEIQKEVQFINLLYGKKSDINIRKGSGCLDTCRYSPIEMPLNRIKKIDDPFFKIKSDSNPSEILPEWLISDYWLYEGIRCNDLFLHADAIVYLNAAIEKDPSNSEAYQERMHAHFEMGNLDLAIEDYKKFNQVNAQKQTASIYEKGLASYSGGFCMGVAQGGGVSIIEFVPTTWSCCKGILHGLWCFSCSPSEVSQDLIIASYELIKFIRENTARECLEVVVPELKDLCANWENFSDYERGSKTGYIIGKYGMDILAPGAVLNGIKKYQHLKRLNSMFTVECCIASEAKQAKILEASIKHASIRSALTESVKMGKIFPQNPNVAAHVMQKKHAWEKVIKLTGDTNKDFSEVIRFLEKNKILQGNKKNIGQFPLGSKSPKINRYHYEIKVNSQVIEAEFIEYIERKEFYLNDAWVKTRS